MKGTLFNRLSSTYALTAITCIVIFLKVTIAHIYLFNGLLLSSLWNNPPAFWSFWLPKIAVSLFIASLALLASNKKWIIIWFLFLDIWIEANLVYYRCNHLFIDYYALSMTSNMDGLWSSCLVFIQLKDLVFFIITCLSSVFYLKTNRSSVSTVRTYMISGGGVMFAICMQLFGNYCHHLAVPEMPFESLQITQKQRFNAWCHEVIPVKENSVCHIILWDIADFCTLGHDSYTMSEEDIKRLKPFISIGKEEPLPKKKCLIIVVESMESWVVNPIVMPNLYTWTHKSHTLYCSRTKSQVRQGTSSDGQLIINTGLLPLQRGAWSFLHPDNEFPALTSLYDNASVSLDPSDGTLWNKHNYLQSWGIENDIRTKEDDKSLFADVLKKVHQNTPCIWTITMSTHAPFEYYQADNQSAFFSKMPNLMAKYTYSFSMVDKAIGNLLDSLSTEGYLNDYVVIITGDHTIIPSENRMEFIEYSRTNDFMFGNVEEYCPLIIIAPNITINTQLEKECYQMDIYPTTLHLIGCEDYFWKGFGVNLLDSTARQNRPISEQDAYLLSDKIIRSDYFRTLEKGQH